MTTLRAFITVMEERALAVAARAERSIAAGKYRGPLHGIPVSVKDLVDVAGDADHVGIARAAAAAGATTRRSSRTSSGPAPSSSARPTCTSSRSARRATRRRSAPCGIRTTARDRPGGSSAGAAVALLEGMCYGSVGTDTGGSIRIPAAACGITGLKPTLGEISLRRRRAAELDARSCRSDGPHRRRHGADVPRHARRRAAARSTSAEAVGPLWLGVPVPYFFDKLDDEVASAVRTRRARRWSGPDTPWATSRSRTRSGRADVYLHIVLPEASWYHAPLLEQHADKYSPGVRLRLEMGRYILAEDYLRAMHARTALRRAVDRALEGLDALLLPALADRRAAARARRRSRSAARTSRCARSMLRLTQLFNVTGHPAIAIPCGIGRDGLPRGHPARRAPRQHRAAARGRRRDGTSDNAGCRVGRRRHRMNVGTARLIRPLGLALGQRAVPVARLVHDVRRRRRIGFRRLFDHAAIGATWWPAASIMTMTIKNLTVQQAHQQQSAGAYLDVRSIPEFEKGHPAGAFNIPLLHLDPQTRQMRPNPEFLAVVKANFPAGDAHGRRVQDGRTVAAGVRDPRERGLRERHERARRLGRRAADGDMPAGCRPGCRSKRPPTRRASTRSLPARSPGTR